MSPSTALDIVDIWVNLVTEQSSRQFTTQEGYENIPGYLGSNTGPVGVDSLLALMDSLGVATGIFTGGLDRNTDTLLEICDAHPGRFLVAGGVGDPSRPGRQVKRLRELAQHPRFALMRVMPLASQVPTNDARHYPLYQVCEELGVPVAINAGIPGPRVRSRVQHPELLEDVPEADRRKVLVTNACRFLGRDANDESIAAAVEAARPDPRLQRQPDFADALVATGTGGANSDLPDCR